MLQLENSPIYIQNVEDTAFTTNQMLVKSEWYILHWEEI